MELERIGEVLAKAMGWRKGMGHVRSDQESAPAWRDSGLLGKTQCLRCNWHPWESWPQAGKVIEEMRARGWRWHVKDCWDGLVRVELSHDSGKSTREEAATEIEARMLCAARALESEAADEQA